MCTLFLVFEERKTSFFTLVKEETLFLLFKEKVMKIVKSYNYEDSRKVIKDAWDLAIDHLKTTLGEQYDYRATKHAWEKFQDYAGQDIEFKKKCELDYCFHIDLEQNFYDIEYKGKVLSVCQDCYEELTDDAE